MELVNRVILPNMITFLQIMVSAGCAWASAYYAEKNGRNELFWFIMGILFTVFALIAVLMLPSLRTQPRRRVQPASEIVVEPLEIRKGSPAPSSIWYYLDKTQRQQGPISFHKLRDLWHQQEVLAETYIWNESMSDWSQVRELEDVHQQLSNQ